LHRFVFFTEGMLNRERSATAGARGPTGPFELSVGFLIAGAALAAYKSPLLVM